MGSSALARGTLVLGAAMLLGRPLPAYGGRTSRPSPGAGDLWEEDVLPATAATYSKELEAQEGWLGTHRVW